MGGLEFYCKKDVLREQFRILVWIFFLFGLNEFTKWLKSESLAKLHQDEDLPGGNDYDIL